MIANAALVASILYLALLFFVMGQLRFLTPWRSLILHQYWHAIAIYSALLIVNLFGIVIYIRLLRGVLCFSSAHFTWPSTSRRR